jgi:hypothetical protein
MGLQTALKNQIGLHVLNATTKKPGNRAFSLSLLFNCAHTESIIHCVGTQFESGSKIVTWVAEAAAPRSDWNIVPALLIMYVFFPLLSYAAGTALNPYPYVIRPVCAEI